MIGTKLMSCYASAHICAVLFGIAVLYAANLGAYLAVAGTAYLINSIVTGWTIGTRNDAALMIAMMCHIAWAVAGIVVLGILVPDRHPALMAIGVADVAIEACTSCASALILYFCRRSRTPE